MRKIFTFPAFLTLAFSLFSFHIIQIQKGEKQSIHLGLIAPAHAADNGKESVFDRVMRTGKLRCGYLTWKDYIDIDVNTGEMSGIIYDYMEQLAHNLGLEMEWTEEVGRGDYPLGLETGRFDAYCTAMTRNAERAKVSDFTIPIMHSLFELYVRQDDTRFDYDLAALNDPDVAFVNTEGDIFGKIARLEFPEAQVIELPQLTQDSDPYLYVVHGKADVTIGNANVSAQYIKKNPGTLRKIALKEPFRYAPLSLVIKADEDRFRRMLDVATEEMLVNGQIDRILDKYDPDREFWLRVGKPYEVQP